MWLLYHPTLGSDPAGSMDPPAQQRRCNRGNGLVDEVGQYLESHSPLGLGLENRKKKAAGTKFFLNAFWFLELQDAGITWHYFVFKVLRDCLTLCVLCNMTKKTADFSCFYCGDSPAGVDWKLPGDAVGCEPCPPGRSSVPWAGSAICQPCPRGRGSDAENSTGETSFFFIFSLNSSIHEVFGCKRIHI